MDAELSRVLEELFRKTGYDLRGYRTSTLTRRLARRLHATHSPDYPSYSQILESSPEECRFLLKDLTIRVTDFFRDWSEEALCEKIWPSLAKQHSIKIWSAGCATGEEAYSLAVSFERFLEKQGLETKYEVLGTDLDEASVDFAKKRKEPLIIPVKERVCFQKLDLVRENFPKNCDFICCRNVLIYFTKELQEKVLFKFYDSLKAEGFLWLGKAESLSENTQKLFGAVDKSMKIFKKESR